MKKFIFKKKLVLVLTTFVLFLNLSYVALAVDTGTVLPATDRSLAQCKALINYINILPGDERKYFLSERRDFKFDDPGFSYFSFTADDIMACAIKTGKIRLWMIPYFIRYFLEFVIQIGGLVAVGGIIYGGYLYLFAGVSDDKDKGKKSIMYSVIGMVMTLLAWAVVNIVIALVTG